MKEFIRDRYDNSQAWHNRVSEGSLRCLCGRTFASKRAICEKTSIREGDVCYFCERIIRTLILCMWLRMMMRVYR